MKILEYNDELRNLCECIIVPTFQGQDEKEKIDFLDYCQKSFGFKNINGWNILCSVMDSIRETSAIITEFRTHGLKSGRGEKLIRLYGLLNAIYCQKRSIQTLSQMLGGKHSFSKLDIFKLRNIITHITDEDDGKHSYQFTYTIEDNRVEIVEHTNRSNRKVYSLMTELGKYDKEAEDIYLGVLSVIKINLSKAGFKDL